MSQFYTKVFGWQTQQLGEEMGGYILVTTTETDSNGITKNPGTINGGFYQKTNDPLSNYPSVVISVDNINNAMKKIKESGGKIIGGSSPDKKHSEEPDDIPGIGLYAAFIDTEGNRVGMLQPVQMG